MVVECLAGVERDTHQARLGQSIVSDKAIDSVRQQNADPVAGDESDDEQCVAESIRECVELAKADDALPFDRQGASPK